MMESKRFHISEDLMLKLMAIVLALSLWLYVQAQEPQTLNQIPLTIEEVSIDWVTSEGYVVTASTGNFADVTVRGTVDIINALQKGEVSIKMDLTEYTAGQYSLVLVPEIPNGISLYNVNPSSIDVVIGEWISSEMKPILDFQSALASDQVLESYTVTPALVTVEGVAADLEKVDQLVLQYDPISMGVSVESMKPIALDSDGEQLNSVVVNGFVNLEINLLKRVILPIEPVFIGELAAGIGYEVDRTVVTVIGSEEDLANIEKIGTLEIDLSSIGTGDVKEVDLLFPGGIRAENQNIKTVTITFE